MKFHLGNWRTLNLNYNLRVQWRNRKTNKINGLQFCQASKPRKWGWELLTGSQVIKEEGSLFKRTLRKSFAGGAKIPNFKTELAHFMRNYMMWLAWKWWGTFKIPVRLKSASNDSKGKSSCREGQGQYRHSTGKGTESPHSDSPQGLLRHFKSKEGQQARLQPALTHPDTKKMQTNERNPHSLSAAGMDRNAR